MINQVVRLRRIQHITKGHDGSKTMSYITHLCSQGKTSLLNFHFFSSSLSCSVIFIHYLESVPTQDGQLHMMLIGPIGLDNMQLLESLRCCLRLVATLKGHREEWSG